MTLAFPKSPALAAKVAGKGRGHPLLSALMELAGRKADLVSHCERSWASATFSGTRHEVVLSFAGAAAIAAGEQFIADLPEHEFTISGSLVADAVVTATDHLALPEPKLQVTAELLLLEEV